LLPCARVSNIAFTIGVAIALFSGHLPDARGLNLWDSRLEAFNDFICKEHEFIEWMNELLGNLHEIMCSAGCVDASP
jgi:hypothetical protein